MMPAQILGTMQLSLEKCLWSPGAHPALPEWDGNDSPGTGSELLGFGFKPPHVSILVLVLALLLLFNSAFNWVPFISVSNPHVSPFLPEFSSSCSSAD